MAMRVRAHPVRGKGRAHLYEVRLAALVIFFQPDVRTRAH